MARLAVWLGPALVASVLTVAAPAPARAELPLCGPWVPRPVRDGRFVRARHTIICNKEMAHISVVGILTRTFDQETYFEIKRKIKHCSLSSKCSVKTRGTILARRQQWFHAWVRGFAIYECKPEEARYCTRRQRREHKRRKIQIAKRRSQCLLIGGGSAASPYRRGANRSRVWSAGGGC